MNSLEKHNDVLESVAVQNTSSIDSLVYFPEVYFTDTGLFGSIDAIFYLVIGSLVSLLYVGLNKFHSIWAQKLEVEQSRSTVQKKFPNIGYIRFSHFRSQVFRLCFIFGLFGAMLFILVILVDLSTLGGLNIPQNVVVHSGLPLIDFIFAGLIFAVIIYPVLTAKLIGSYGFGMVVDIFLNPTDSDIYEDINNSRLDYIRSKVRKFEKKNNGNFTITDFKKKIRDWYELQQTVTTEPDKLLTALQNADDKFPDDVVHYIASVMKSFGDIHVRRALDSRY